MPSPSVICFSRTKLLKNEKKNIIEKREKKKENKKKKGKKKEENKTKRENRDDNLKCSLCFR